jgi:MAP/microtubule affinity-regulating kinase
MLSLLGQGGFGKVLLAQHRGSKQKVAIKIVNTASIGNAEDIDMVFREAEMLKSLVHHNIVKIYNCFTLTNMQVVYVMEYLEGGELLDYVQSIHFYVNPRTNSYSRVGRADILLIDSRRDSILPSLEADPPRLEARKHSAG